jgi:alpha-L-fucosidase
VSAPRCVAWTRPTTYDRTSHRCARRGVETVAAYAATKPYRVCRAHAIEYWRLHHEDRAASEAMFSERQAAPRRRPAPAC